ncbi:MAG: hypothetical protein ACAI35_12575 [Candidatus Methylacidiphilales bacterium]|nr:hypothetical protein [Candidatus Methylacidiphilales bacterium]
MKCKNCGFFNVGQLICSGCGHRSSSLTQPVCNICKTISASLNKVVPLENWPQSLLAVYAKYYPPKLFLFPLVYCFVVGMISFGLLQFIFYIFYSMGLVHAFAAFMLIPVFLLLLNWLFTFLADKLQTFPDPLEGSLLYHERQLTPEWQTNINYLYEINDRAINAQSDEERNECITMMDGLRLTLTKQACALYIIQTEKLKSRVIELSHQPLPESEEAYLAATTSLHEIAEEASTAKEEICQEYCIQQSDSYRNILDEESQLKSMINTKLLDLEKTERDRIKRENLQKIGRIKLIESRDKAEAFIEARKEKLVQQVRPVLQQPVPQSDDLEWETTQAKFKALGDARVVRDTDRDSDTPSGS